MTSSVSLQQSLSSSLTVEGKRTSHQYLIACTLYTYRHILYGVLTFTKYVNYSISMNYTSENLLYHSYKFLFYIYYVSWRMVHKVLVNASVSNWLNAKKLMLGLTWLHVIVFRAQLIYSSVHTLNEMLQF